MCEELRQRDLSCLHVCKKRPLRFVFPVFDAGLALQHAPGLAPLHAEQHQLARDGAVLDVAVRSLHPDVHAEIRNVRAVLRIEVAAIDDILLGDADEHVLERNQPRRVVLLDLLQVIAEARFRRAPVSDRVAV